MATFFKWLAVILVSILVGMFVVSIYSLFNGLQQRIHVPINIPQDDTQQPSGTYQAGCESVPGLCGMYNDTPDEMENITPEAEVHSCTEVSGLCDM